MTEIRRSRFSKKRVVSAGLILLVVGVAISVFPSQETWFETTTEKTLPFTQITLASQNTTSVGTLMKPGMWFQLNISSSDSVNVTVLVVEHGPSGPTKVPIWGPSTGSSFNQKVSTSGTGTYFIEIKNENPFPVTLDGNVLVQQNKTNYRTIYPYFLPGFLIILVGTTTLLFGIFKKPRRRPSKSKIHTKRK